MINIDWGAKIINIPQADLISLGGNIYELDVDAFRLILKDLEDSIEGMSFPDTHRHNTIVTVAGVTLARVIEIINGYTITFENAQYAVNLVGANSNIPDVANVNQVSIRSFNTAGLIQVGSGVLPQDISDIADAVWDETSTEHLAQQSMGRRLELTSLQVTVSGIDITTSGMKTDFDDFKGDYTTDRATNLDNIDTTISSRATPSQILATPDNLLSTSNTGRVDANVSYIADAAIRRTTVAEDAHSFQGNVWLQSDNTLNVDRYTIVTFKNGSPFRPETSPLFKVISTEDGSDLIPETSTTEVGSCGIYKFTESVRRITKGHIYIVKVRVIMGNHEHIWHQPVGRDS